MSSLGICRQLCNGLSEERGCVAEGRQHERMWMCGGVEEEQLDTCRELRDC
jgi:hypothetical protein